jgi:hypothetical protein
MRLQMPPIEKPINWVGMTTSHWSEWRRNWSMNGNTRHRKVDFTFKRFMLIIEDLLDGYDVGLNVV